MSELNNDIIKNILIIYDIKNKFNNDIDNENNIVDIDKSEILYKTITTLSAEELVGLWQKHWKLSQTAFCRNYNLHRGNFSLCLKFKKRYLVAIEAIKDYILRSCGLNITGNFCVKTCNILDIYDYIVSHDIIGSTECDKFILVDNDNIGEMISGILSSGMLSFRMVEHLHIFIFKRSDQIIQNLGNSNTHNLIRIVDSGLMPEAADAAILTTCSILSTISKLYLKKIKICIISKDHFMKTIKYNMDCLGMNCILIDNLQEVESFIFQ